MDKFILYDSELNAIDFLEKFVVFHKLSKSDPSYYKWIVISLFSALYGFAVSVSRETANSLNAKDITFKKKNGEDRLEDFDAVLKMCQDRAFMRKGVNSRALKLTLNQKESISRLKNELRNNFEHFLPNFSWKIEIALIESIIPDILGVIEFLVFETNTYGFLDLERKKKIEILLDDYHLSTPADGSRGESET